MLQFRHIRRTHGVIFLKKLYRKRCVGLNDNDRILLWEKYCLSHKKSTAIKENVEFRRGLPTDYKLIMGVSNSDREDRAAEREQFSNVVMSLMQNMIQYADVDKACDELAKNDTHCALPPVLSKDEANRTVQCRSRFLQKKQHDLNIR